jgi:prephenate dehydrogenase
MDYATLEDAAVDAHILSDFVALSIPIETLIAHKEECLNLTEEDIVVNTVVVKYPILSPPIPLAFYSEAPLT